MSKIKKDSGQAGMTDAACHPESVEGSGFPDQVVE